jgi:uncharacterized protein YbaR (Trm112 family)
MKEVTELYCHACNGYFKVEFDLELSGNHVVACPKCKHEHCRVIQGGKVTGDRWGQRNGQTYNYAPSMTTYTATASTDSSSAGSWCLADSWNNSTSTFITYTTA